MIPLRYPYIEHSGIFLFSPQQNYKMLLQRRALHKVTFPGVWSNACCSHPLTSDLDIHSAMLRKLQDELGITRNSFLNKDDFKFLGKLQYSALSQANPSWGEHEFGSSLCRHQRCLN